MPVEDCGSRGGELRIVMLSGETVEDWGGIQPVWVLLNNCSSIQLLLLKMLAYGNDE